MPQTGASLTRLDPQGAGLRRVVVFRALQLGDMLCAVPALRALRHALPTAEIVLVGLPWAGAFVERFGTYLDGFRAFPGYPGLPEQAARNEALPDFLRAVQAERFDLTLQLHGSGLISNPLVALFGARVTAGGYVSGHYCPDPATFAPYPDDGHEVRRLLRVLDGLGVPPQGEALEFPITASDEAALRTVAEAEGLTPGAYVCVHPGARAEGRRWPPAEFAAVGDALAGHGLRVVVTGSRDEAPLAAEVVRHMRAPAVDLAGRTDLGGMAALLRGARLLVCNNTGVCHLGAALRVPGVALFHEPAEVRRWAPLDGQRHRVVCGFAGARAAVLAHARALLDAGEAQPPPAAAPGPRDLALPG